MPVGVGSVMVQSRADVSNGQFYVAVARALAEEHQRTAGCSTGPGREGQVSPLTHF